MSEIDDIFAKRPASTSVVPPKEEQKKRRTKQKQAPEMKTSELSSNKRPAPETVVDPSSHTAPLQKKSKVRADKDIDKFKDSRGNGPRRKTEEGWLIYKEDELGINDVGGDTPLCPFDCECCF